MRGISSAQWDKFYEFGFLKVDVPLDPKDLHTLQEVIDAIMLGAARVKYDDLMMELDPVACSDDDDTEYSRGSKGASLNYKRIQHLEFEPRLLRYLQSPLFREGCAEIYGSNSPISVFRAMFVNKPAHGGARIGWHQDCWNYLNVNPVLTVWTALDPAREENGCLQIVPGSHRRGQINPDNPSGFLTEEMVGEFCREQDIVSLEMEAGEIVFLHNLLLHASDPNRSDQRRRAFSVCYMNASTLDLETSHAYPVVFGDGALSPERFEDGSPLPVTSETVPS